MQAQGQQLQNQTLQSQNSIDESIKMFKHKSKTAAVNLEENQKKPHPLAVGQQHPPKNVGEPPKAVPKDLFYHQNVPMQQQYEDFEQDDLG